VRSIASGGLHETCIEALGRGPRRTGAQAMTLDWITIGFWAVAAVIVAYIAYVLHVGLVIR